MSRRKQLKPRCLNNKDETQQECSTEGSRSFETVRSDQWLSEVSRGSIMHREENMLTCEFCSAEFTTNPDELERHLQAEQSKFMLFKCEHCLKSFSQKHSLERHYQLLHFSTKNFRCKFCECAFSRPDQLKRHMNLHSCLKASTVCLHCNMTFLSQDAYNQHIQEIHYQDDQHNVDIDLSERSASAPVTTIASPDFLAACPVGMLLRQCNSSDSSILRPPKDAAAHTTSHSPTSDANRNDIFAPSASYFGTNQEHLSYEVNGHSFTSRQDSSNSSANADVDSVREKVSTLSSSLFICGICKQSFLDVTKLQLHTLQAHSLADVERINGSSYSVNQCQFCFMKFDSIRELDSHLCSYNSADVAGKLKCSNENKSIIPSVACDVCGMTFSSEVLLDGHYICHFLQRESQYSCKGCSKTYGAASDLEKHVLEAHTSQLFKCRLCQSLFETTGDLQLHCAVAHNSQSNHYRCRSCNSVFNSESQFHVHLEAVHLNRPLTCLRRFCLLCNKSFSSDEEYGLHCDLHKTFTCPICSEAFLVEFLCERHIELEHSNQIQDVAAWSSLPSDAVNLCKQNSPPSSSRVRSAEEKNGKTSDPLSCLSFSNPGTTRGTLKCNICDKKCDNLNELMEHKLQHCKVVHSDVCSICHETIQSVESFYHHTQIHAQRGAPVSCIVCRQSLVSSGDLRAHAKYHLLFMESPLLCKLCGAQVSAASNSPTCQDDLCISCSSNHSKTSPTTSGCYMENALSAMRSVNCIKQEPQPFEDTEDKLEKTKQFQCIKCQKFFPTEEEIHEHVASHLWLDGVLHHCALCNSVFDSPAKLQCHLIEHSFVGCLEFRCYLCGLIFSLSQPLQQHLLTAHRFEERPYDCPDVNCNQRFFFRAELENHLMAYHAGTAGRDKSADSSTVSSSATVVLTTTACLKRISVPLQNANSKHLKTSSTTGVGDSTTADFPCPHCPKVFGSLSALQGHSHVHMSTRIHKCSKCRKVFGTSGKLRVHLQQHDDKQLLKCQICGHGFLRKDNLEAHLKLHWSKVSEQTGVALTKLLAKEDSTNVADV